MYVDDIKLAGKKHNIDPMWKVLNKEVDLGEPTSFLDHVYLGCTQRQCEISKDIVWQLQDHNPEFPQEQPKNYHARKICVFLRGHMTCKDMPRNGWSDIVSWQTRRLNNSTKYLLPALMTTTSVGELSKVCSQFVPKLVHTWHVLIFFAQWTNLHDQLQNGPKLVTNVWRVRFLTFITCVNSNDVVMWGTSM